MKYMQISILKEKKNEELTTGYVKDHAFYNMTWFKNPAFRRSDSEKNRKDFVRKQLSEVNLSEKKFGRIFDEEERVIVMKVMLRR
jgi:hypothetical protein